MVSQHLTYDNYTLIEEIERDEDEVIFIRKFNADEKEIYFSDNETWRISKFDKYGNKNYHLDSTGFLSISKWRKPITLILSDGRSITYSSLFKRIRFLPSIERLRIDESIQVQYFDVFNSVIKDYKNDQLLFKTIYDYENRVKITNTIPTDFTYLNEGKEVQILLPSYYDEIIKYYKSCTQLCT